MKKRMLALGLFAALGLLAFSAPAGATQRIPDLSVVWTTGTPLTLPLGATRFDGEYVSSLNRVYFLGWRQTDNLTNGSVYYYDVATDTYVDTGRDLRVPISNYQIAALQDSHGLGLYVFGGRAEPAPGVIVTNVQVYYPSTNQVQNLATDPWPGTTPSGCVSLPGNGVAVVQNKAYVMGGLAFTANGCVADEQSAQTWAFDPMAPAGTRWSAAPSLNVARGYVTPAVSRGTIYAIGGDTNLAGTLIPSQTVERWKPGTPAWNDAQVADLPVACDESQAFTPASGPLRRGITLATCGQWPNATGDSYFYNGSTNSWSLFGSTNEARRNEAGAIFSVGGVLKMYIAGGYDATGGLVLASTETGVGAPIGSRPGFSRPAPHAGAKATTS